MRLYIGGALVHLPSNFSTEYYSKSPYFTNEGDFTLNIDLDLKDPVNARVYAHVHRIDRTKRAKRRDAVLQDEHGVVVKGKEVLLDVTDDKASIQIVGGTSELNYEIGDKRLRDLDLWSPFDRVGGEVAFFPVCALNDTDYAKFDLIAGDEFVEEDDVRKQKWAIINRPKLNSSATQYVMSYDIGQPYFWAIMERVITALGFDIGTNVLKTDSRYNKMVMVHAIRSPYIADILPDWKVSKLFDEIQRFFNVVVNVDISTHSVNIVHAHQYFTDDNMEELKHGSILSVDKSYDNDKGMTMVDYAAVHYAFTNRDTNKYADISEQLKAVCTVLDGVSVSGVSHDYYSYLWQAIMNGASWQSSINVPDAVKAFYGQRVLLRDTFHNEQRTFVLWNVDDLLCTLKMVDAFGAKTSRREGVSDVELHIVPVRMASSPVQGRDSSWWQYPLPAVDGEASSYKGVSWGGSYSIPEDPETNINDDIKSGYKEEGGSNRADVMFAAFYLGELYPYSWEPAANNVPSGLKLPIASPDWQVQLMIRGWDIPGKNIGQVISDAYFWESARHVRLGTDKLTMAINGANGMDAYTYSKNSNSDTSVTYTIRFKSHKNLDVRKVWLIDNRMFYCKELKYTIRDGKRSEIVEGTFLPVLSSSNQGESGEVEYYVSYNLDRVLVSGNRPTVVTAGEPFRVDLQLTAGGSGSSTINGSVEMGGVDVTSTAWHAGSTWGTAYVEIANVTGDVFVKAWRD